MRFILIFVVALVILIENVYSSMTMAQIESTKKLLRNVCQPKNKVTNEQIENMRKGNFVTDRELMCYMECCLKSAQLMKDGKLNYESAKIQAANLPPELAGPALTHLELCKGVNSSDKCEIAYELYKCFYDHDPAHFFLP